MGWIVDDLQQPQDELVRSKNEDIALEFKDDQVKGIKVSLQLELLQRQIPSRMKELWGRTS